MISSVLDGLGEAAELPAQARCFGLLGAVVRDLAPVGYKPYDNRYPTLQGAVIGIFDPERSKSIGIQVAVEAADALGNAGDPQDRNGFTGGGHAASILPTSRFQPGST